MGLFDRDGTAPVGVVTCDKASLSQFAGWQLRQNDPYFVNPARILGAARIEMGSLVT